MKFLASILKQIFPRIYLKRAFLIYNVCKINTWDRIFFKREGLENQSYHFEEKNPFLELNIDVSKFDHSIRQKLEIWIDPDWKQDQYLLTYRKPGYLDPLTGWAISFTKRLIYPSLGFASAPHVHKPSVRDVFMLKKSATDLNRIISLRDTGEENYFHFFNDVLPKLFFLKESAVDINAYSLVISKSLFEKQYFKFFFQTPELSELTWYVQQPDEWIKFDEAIFCKPYTHTKRYFDKTIDLTKRISSNRNDRRVFLTRSRLSLRYIENLDEMLLLLDKLNFEIVDTSKMSVEEQINLFNSCRYLVAIHGAGITNIIFRSGKPLSLLEIIQPSPYIPFHYIMLCKLFDYNYDALLGYPGRESNSGGFLLNMEEFERKLLSLIRT